MCKQHFLNAIVGTLLGVAMMLTVDNAFAQTCPSDPPLVSAWSFEDNANDPISSNNGLLVGGPGFINGVIGKAITLDGVDDYVSVADDPSLTIGTADFSLILWVNPADLSGFHMIYHRRVGSGNKELEIRLGHSSGDGKIFAQTNNSANGGQGVQLISVTSVPTNQYTFIAIVRKGSQMQLFIDGMMHTVINGPAQDVAAPGQPTHIGTFAGNPGVSAFEGEIDQMQLFRRALNPHEIRALYTAVCASSCVCGTHSCP